MKYLMYIALILVFFSCKKSEDRACWKFMGDEITLTKAVNSFDSLFAYKNIVFELYEATENKLEITGGENVVNFIEVLEENGKVSIRNKNKCLFLRNYKKKITVKVYASDLKYIYSESSESFTAGNTLNFPSLVVLIRDGAGKMKLNVNNQNLQVDVTHGWGDFELEGNTVNLGIFCRTNSFCDTRKLSVSNKCFVFNRSVGDMYVNTEGCFLETVIENSGNVYYNGTPTAILTTITGEGQLISL